MLISRGEVGAKVIGALVGAVVTLSSSTCPPSLPTHTHIHIHTHIHTLHPRSQAYTHGENACYTSGAKTEGNFEKKVWKESNSSDFSSSDMKQSLPPHCSSTSQPSLVPLGRGAATAIGCDGHRRAIPACGSGTRAPFEEASVDAPVPLPSPICSVDLGIVVRLFPLCFSTLGVLVWICGICGVEYVAPPMKYQNKIPTVIMLLWLEILSRKNNKKLCPPGKAGRYSGSREWKSNLRNFRYSLGDLMEGCISKSNHLWTCAQSLFKRERVEEIWICVDVGFEGVLCGFGVWVWILMIVGRDEGRFREICNAPVERVGGCWHLCLWSLWNWKVEFEVWFRLRFEVGHRKTFR